MARKTMWAVVGALLAFAPAASAATYGLTIDGEKIYATEVISSGTTVEYDVTEPMVTIFLGLSDTEAAAIEQDDALEVMLTLSGATFADDIRESDMDVSTTITACDIRVREVEDGNEGENNVMFTIEAGGQDCTCSGCGANVNMEFTLPDLTGLNGRTPVTVAVETNAPGGSNWIDTSATGVGTNAACTGNVMVNSESVPATTQPCVRIEDGVLGRLTAVSDGARANHAIVTFAPGFTFSGTSGGASSINLEAGRRGFTWPFQAYLGTVTLGVTSAAACTQRDNPPANCVLQTDGRPFSVDRGGRGDGQGVLNVAVTGDFRRGDRVWLDVNRNNNPDGNEMLDLDSDGVMRESFSLDETAGNLAAGAGLANEMNREEGVVTHNLIYRPNGTDPLRPGDYRASFSVDFNSAAVADKSATPASGAHNTTYTTIEDSQHAYAIPPIGAGDQSQVRIKCEVATQCTVYLECDDTEGGESFARLEDPIAGRSTTTLSSMDIAETLGLGADGWSGRLACTVHSTRDIAVQVLTRAANGVLVNNTYVDS